jgi:hypothetical protein
MRRVKIPGGRVKHAGINHAARVFQILQLGGASSIRRPKVQRWLHKFGRYDKWNFCLTTGTLVPANQERQ